MLWSETGRTINSSASEELERGAPEKDEVPTNSKCKYQVYMKCIVDTELAMDPIRYAAKFCMEALGVSANPTQIETTEAVRSCTVWL